MFYVLCGLSLLLLCALMALFNALLDGVQARFERSEEMMQEKESAEIASMSDPKKRLQAMGKLRQGPGMGVCGKGGEKGAKQMGWWARKTEKIRKVAAGQISSSEDEDEDPCMARELNILRQLNVSAPHQKSWRKVVKAIACMAECGGRCGELTCAQTMTHLTTCTLHRCERCIRLTRLVALHANYCHVRRCKVPGCRELREEAVEQDAAMRRKKKRKPKGVTIVRAKDDNIITPVAATSTEVVVPSASTSM